MVVLNKPKSLSIDWVKTQVHESWFTFLSPFLESYDFQDIMYRLKEESNANVICPKYSQIFNAFTFPYDELKVVFLLQDPYPKKGVASGVAMDCSNTGIHQPSLELFQNEIVRTCRLEEYHYSPSLWNLVDQGFLFTNTSLTTLEGDSNVHQHMWRPFTRFLIESLDMRNNGLIFVFCGRVAQAFEHLVTAKHYKFVCEHPAAAAWQERKWNSSGIFPDIQKILLSNYKHKVIW